MMLFIENLVIFAVCDVLVSFVLFLGGMIFIDQFANKSNMLF